MVLTVIGLSLITAGTAPPAADAPAYLPSDIGLVRVITVKVWNEPKGGPERGLLRVKDVVAGPDKWKGREFEATTDPYIPLGTVSSREPSSLIPVPHLELGVEGLWWVYQDGALLRPELRRNVVRTYHLFGFPYQKLTNPSFELGLGEPRTPAAVEQARRRLQATWDEGEAWATVVKSVHQARTDADCKLLLQKCAALPGSPIAGWAMARLATGPKHEAAAFLHGLVGKNSLSPDAQVTLDRLLCRLDSKEWAGSKERRVLLSRWLGSDRQGVVQLVIGCDRLSESVGEGDVEVAMMSDVLKRVITDTELAGPQSECVGRVLALTRYPVRSRDATVQWLTEVCQRGGTTGVRMGAAKGLLQFRPLTTAEQGKARGAAEREQDGSIRKILDSMIN